MEEKTYFVNFDSFFRSGFPNKYSFGFAHRVLNLKLNFFTIEKGEQNFIFRKHSRTKSIN